MPEQVYNVAQIGPQAGTFAAPGASAAAIALLPVTERVMIELDRASTYPGEDLGRNFRSHAGRGYHGARGASLDLNGELSFEQWMHLAEMHYAGSITPTGVGPYVWVYPLETGAPTLVPYTVESGSESSSDQWEAVGVLVDELTLGFDDLDAPGAHPWTFEASCLALDRAAAALTGSLTPPTTETMLGHLSIIKWGTTATAFASLTEIASSLVSFQIVTRRHLVLRIYGGTSDIATGYGFSEWTDGEITAKVKISATTKTDVHDAWNSSGAALGEKRFRVTVDGSGDREFNVDGRVGMTAVPVGERDGERVFERTGQLVYDDTLTAGAQLTGTNGVADLTP